MLTLKKIRTLKSRTQVRKCGSQMLVEARNPSFSDDYILGLRDILFESDIVSDADKTFISGLFDSYLEKRDSLYAKDIYYAVLHVLGEEVADWDAVDDSGALSTGREVKRHTLFLDRVRSPYNIGAIFRSAEAFAIDRILLREGCGDVSSPRCLRTSRGTVDTVPCQVGCALDVLDGRTVFALETGGVPIEDFCFPEDAICVLGSEEDGVSPDVLARCTTKVSIGMTGSKGSLNVSVAAGILMHAWSLHP